METTCPSCGMENAAYDEKLGLFICPDCGHEWNEDLPHEEPGSEDIETGTGD